MLKTTSIVIVSITLGSLLVACTTFIAYQYLLMLIGDGPITASALRRSSLFGFGLYETAIGLCMLYFYEETSLKHILVFFVLIPIIAFFFWPFFGQFLSFCAIVAIASLACYQVISIASKKKRGREHA